MANGKLVQFIALAALIVGGAYLVFQPLVGSINYGLDLQGGVHVVGQAKPGPGQTLTGEDMSQLQEVMRNRVDELGVSEPVIQREGEDRLIVELAGVKDPDAAVEAIGRTAMLEFRTMDDELVLTGQDLADALPARDPATSEPIIELEFKSAGAQKFSQVTSQLVQQYPEGDPRRHIAIFLDKELLTNPHVDEAITTGKAVIRGGFASFDEAANLAALLRGGALPVNLEIIEKRTVGPSLGQDSLQKSAVAVTVGLAAIALFMLLYYRLPGLIADFSLIVYAIILLAALVGMQATLTLPGIAGLLLSAGMAVDANIIIYERLKDELRRGKSLRAAVDAGFRRAIWTIVDANVTTLITAAVLYYLGTGPIRGFAVTLSLGILASMFTAVFLTRWMLRLVASIDVLRRESFFGVRRVAPAAAVTGVTPGVTGAAGEEMTGPAVQANRWGTDQRRSRRHRRSR